MVSQPTVYVLSISDKIIEDLRSSNAAQKYRDVDLLLACGDLPYYYIEEVFENLGVPTFYVRGNHANPVEYSAQGEKIGPSGAVDLHGKFVHYNNLLMAGFEGSLRYKPGPFMYTQGEMWALVLKLAPRLVFNKLVYGRYLDVVIAHAPPWGIHDQPDQVHQGFKAFRWLIKVFKPAYFFHGHIHVYEEDTQTDTVVHHTRVINTYGLQLTEVQAGKKHFEKSQRRPARKSLDTPLDDFRDARLKASVRAILAGITGKSTDLLSFERVRKQLRTGKSYHKGVQEIPIEAIVGSVGRHQDFDRKFFPRQDSDKDRWTRVKKITDSQVPIEPIDVYQIGETYFVLDGNHRVSACRQRGDSHIPAYVTEIETRVPLQPEDRHEDMIIKEQLAKFLEDTKLNETRPIYDFNVSTCGSFRELRNHIAAHKYYYELTHGGKEISFQDAAADWVDQVYIPINQSIWQQGLLRDFPGRTPADLFLWIVDHLAELRESVGWQVAPDKAAASLAERYSLQPGHWLRRIQDKIFPSAGAGLINFGPPPGKRHNLILTPRSEDRLFASILVPLTGDPDKWNALDQALNIAQKENGTVRGLHLIPKDADDHDPKIFRISEEFYKRCDQSGIDGEFVTDSGNIAATISNRGQWNDLIVFDLEHPPEDRPMARLRSGVRMLIQSSPRPVLSVPNLSSMQHGLLAYDGSRKADEAMFLAVYLARNWGIKLSVFTRSPEYEGRQEVYERAKAYIDSREVEVDFVYQPGPTAKSLVRISKQNGCDFLIMGGYGHRPVKEVMLGSTVDHVLRQYKLPVMICR